MHRTSANEPETGKKKVQRGFGKLLTIQAFSSNMRERGHVPAKSEIARGNGPKQVKPALRAPGVPRKKGKRSVRFKGMVSSSYAHIVANCVQYTRSGSAGAAWWEAFMAGIVTFDFFCVPLGSVWNAFSAAVQAVSVQGDPAFQFGYLLVVYDFIFFINIVFNLCQVRCLAHNPVQ